ncbi:Polyketide synthase [Pyrenophora tritici-repentis]|nr:Polyketide synthase [Pyrenophora tritici-repentis]
MGGWEPIPTLMSATSASCGFSHKLFTLPGNPLLHVATKEIARTFREFEWDASTLLAETGEPVIVARGERGTVIAGAGSRRARFSYGIDFQPDLSLLDAPETEAHLKALYASDPQFSPDPKDAEAVDRADAIALYYIEQALDNIDNGEPLTFDNHLTKYVDFLRKVRANRNNFYHCDFYSRHYRKAGAYMRMLAHANPQLRICEVGAGTGSATSKVLPFLVDTEGLDGDRLVRFGEYAYTDVSVGFFEKAREKFSFAEKYMRFAKLDLESHPPFKALNSCLRDLHALLRPGGKLIMMETTVDNIRDGIIFGCCRGEDEALGPILTEDGWDAALKTAGFSVWIWCLGITSTKPRHRVSTLVTTRPEEVEVEAAREHWAKLAAVPWIDETDTYTLDGVVTAELELSRTNIISLLEVDTSLFGTITGPQFEALKKISLDAKKVIWLTRGGSLALAILPPRWQSVFREAFVTLSLDTDDFIKGTSHVLRLLEHFHKTGSKRADAESEYTVHSGLIHIPRIVPQRSVNQTLAARAKLPDKLSFTLAGLLDTLYYTETPTRSTQLQPGEVEIEVAAASLNFRDVMIALASVGYGVYAFDYVGRLRKGESVLIHAGAGAVGQAAIQLAQLRGAEIFVTVGSKWKRELRCQFVDDVFHATANRGVDVVLNSLGGELLQHSWRCTAPFGRFIDIGKADILANNTLEMGHFLRNVTFAAIDVAGMYAENKPLMQLVLDDVFSLFAANPGLHNPKPLHAFAPSRIEEAMRALQGGKIATPGDVVEYQPARMPTYGFEAQATNGAVGQYALQYDRRAILPALAPKYQGSWNLHELLPKDMDFMVFLSSMSGVIGNPAQANYAAGNTFEDALARHRAANGLKGVSFDLGLVLEAGWASDNLEDVTKSLRAGLGGMTQKQLMAIWTSYAIQAMTAQVAERKC